jgi:hypothetical protein
MEVPQATLAVQGELVYAIARYEVESSAPVQVLDLATNTWTALPASPHLPAIDDREVVATDNGLVVMGGELSPRQAEKHHRQPALAEVWDGSTWTRYQSEHAAGQAWHWTGERIVSAYRVTEQDSARGMAYEFRAAAFDPATGDWTQLPWLPPWDDGLLEPGWSQAYGPRVLGGGYLYDDRTGDSLPIEKPSDWDSRTQILTDRSIVVIGGARPQPGQTSSRLMKLDLTNEAWLLPLG